MLCKRLRSLSEVSSSWGYVSCFCCQRGARGLPSRAQAWKPDVTFRLESLSRAHRAQSGVYIQPTVSSSSSFALLYFPSDFRYFVFFPAARCLRVCLSPSVTPYLWKRRPLLVSGPLHQSGCCICRGHLEPAWERCEDRGGEKIL